MPAAASAMNIDIAVAVLLFALGFLCLIFSRKLIRMIIGLEIMARAATLSFIAYGAGFNNTSISQALVITVIVVEVVVTSIALALIMNLAKFGKSVQTQDLNKLKG